MRIPSTGFGYAGLGDITDPNLQSAASALLSTLQSSGCTNGYDQTTADFQNAWNAANAGSPLVNAQGQTAADGLYGANTQAALQATLNASGTVQQAPTGCVAAAPGSANATQGGGAAVVPVVVTPGTVTPGTVSTVTQPTNSNWILWVVGAAAVAGVGATYMVYKKRAKR